MIERKCPGHVLLRRLPVHPQPQPHALLPRIVNDCLEIEPVDSPGDVGAFVGHDVSAVPGQVVYPVERVIRNAVLRAEIDVVLGRLGIETHLERHAHFVEIVPPWKRRLAWLDPRSVFDHARRIELQHGVRFEQLPRFLADQDQAPRRLMRQGRADGNLRLVRAGREPADQTAARGCAALKIHAGIVGQVRFEDGGPTDARQLHQQRQPQQPVGRNLIDAPPFVTVLVRRGEARQRQRRGERTCREHEFRQFVSQFQIRPTRLSGKPIPQRNAIVIRPHRQSPFQWLRSALAQHERSFGRAIDHMSPLARILLERGVDLDRFVAHDHAIATEFRTLFQANPQVRRIDDGSIRQRNSILELARCSGRGTREQLDFETSIWRLDDHRIALVRRFGRAGCWRCAPGQQAKAGKAKKRCCRRAQSCTSCRHLICCCRIDNRPRPLGREVDADERTRGNVSTARLAHQSLTLARATAMRGGALGRAYIRSM